MLLKRPDQTEGNYLVVTIQHEGKLVLAGLREPYWRQWEGHHIPRTSRNDPGDEGETTFMTPSTVKS
jgi:hypothetical protein